MSVPPHVPQHVEHSVRTCHGREWGLTASPPTILPDGTTEIPHCGSKKGNNVISFSTQLID